MTQIPDVRVRLSADGVSEIVRAFQAVSAEAQKTGKSGRSAMTGLNNALKSLTGILPTLTFGGAVAGMTAMVKSAINSADSIGKLAQKTGVGTEALSALQLAASTADVEFDALQGGLVKFNRTMADLDGGSREAAQAVRQLFGSARALDGLGTEQRLEQVVSALGKMQAGYAKTRLAQDLFGKSGADLIPLMNDISDQGMAKLTERARELGLLVGSDLADAAQRANDAITTLRNEVKGAATQFASGFVPALANALEAVSASTSEAGFSGFERLGRLAASVLRTIVSGFLIIGETIGFEVANWSIWFDDFGQHVKDGFADVALGAKQLLGAVTGNIARFVSAGDLQAAAEREARRATAAAAARARRDAFDVALGQRLNGLFDDKAPTAKSGRGAGPEAPRLDPAAQKAELDLVRARLDAELALNKAFVAQMEQANQAAFDAGTKSVAAYYDERTRIQSAAFADEIASLEARRATIVADAGATAADLKRIEKEKEAVDDEIRRKRVEHETEAARLLADRTKAERELARQRTEVERQVLESQGRTFDAARIAIQRQREELLAAHVDEGTVRTLTDLLTKQAAFSEAQRQAGLETQRLGQSQADLQRQVASGKLFPFEAVQRYREEAAKSIPVLEKHIADMRATGLASDDAGRGISELESTLADLRVTADGAGQTMAQFKASVESGFVSAFSTFLTSDITQATDALDAMRRLALGLAEALQQAAAQIVATAAAQRLLGVFSTGSKQKDPAAEIATAAAIGLAQAKPLKDAANDLNIAGLIVFASAEAMSKAADKMKGAARAQSAGTAAVSFAQGNTGGAIGGILAFFAGFFADGGHVRGPGTSRSDSIPAMLSDGEFVVNAGAVAQPGVLPLLAALNGGLNLPPVRSLGPASAMRGYADGGMVAGAGASGLTRDQVHISIEPGLIAQHIENGPGSRAVVRAVAAHRRAIREALGIT